jgi:hypothetical protein
MGIDRAFYAGRISDVEKTAEKRHKALHALRKALLK